ncbi:hypothetical protein [Tsukamurella ocularis]|uniref:hypothetical protein n=1 Tax=Tsukamurella ocularis TaxID=1970234 RepID=UPI00216A88A8|nr:hypothetical protein [Tsukamurella ocularis]MCS3781870.1 hypothetical protein [Tsukamurella ocularis]MCS3788364.1 hypothetical protein [Tsukamurella ocularis]MCS3852084.1 hypothetical protein [Tsukamurella ocularis]
MTERSCTVPVAATVGRNAIGVATTPIALLPFWLSASSRLAREGGRRPAAGRLPGAAAMLAGGLAGSFAVAALVQPGVHGCAT